MNCSFAVFILLGTQWLQVYLPLNDLWELPIKIICLGIVKLHSIKIAVGSNPCLKRLVLNDNYLLTRQSPFKKCLFSRDIVWRGVDFLSNSEVAKWVKICTHVSCFNSVVLSSTSGFRWSTCFCKNVFSLKYFNGILWLLLQRRFGWTFMSLSN